MAQKISGNTSALTSSEKKIVERLFSRRIEKEEIVPLDIAREMYSIAERLNRRVGILVTREGRIEEVFLGKKDILYLPDLGRFRLGKSRLRRLRLIFTDLAKDASAAHIPQDIYTDLEKLRLDLVASVRVTAGKTLLSYAYLLPTHQPADPIFRTELNADLTRLEVNFQELIEDVESELSTQVERRAPLGGNRALLVGVYEKSFSGENESLAELTELARTAGVEIAGRVVQKRRADPRTLLGAGKLEEVVLTCLRLGADLLIFDTELKPNQWRSITKETDLKVIDRSMLILDIFAQRASSADGRVQVELAQLKYNLPRLTEMDSGLSRLSGGIGGRGPGETKLEVGRRVVRDRITMLERKIADLKTQRFMKKRRRIESSVPLIAIVGYTNVGKSTLFNVITKSDVIAENKLFATLDPAKRRLIVPRMDGETSFNLEMIVSDTVGFIRDLPDELMSAFQATLEEIGDASLLIHVLDASDPQIDARKTAVESILEGLGFHTLPTITVLNKCDRTTPEKLAELKSTYKALPTIATTRQGVPQLIEELSKTILEISAQKREHQATLDLEKSLPPL